MPSALTIETFLRLRNGPAAPNKSSFEPERFRERDLFCSSRIRFVCGEDAVRLIAEEQPWPSRKLRPITGRDEECVASHGRLADW